MLLSVIIVNWNSRDDLHACLTSLGSQTHDALDVVVVDNGSEDDSVEMVQRDFPAFLLLPQQDNLGFAEGCNRGIDASRGEWIALLNNDAVAEPAWAAELVAAAEHAAPTCGMLQSLMLYEKFPDKVNSTGIELTRSGRGHDRHDGERRPIPGGPWEEIFCPTGGAAAFRKTMLMQLRLPSGYLDRNHFCYYEDLDLGWRARLASFITNTMRVPRDEANVGCRS